MDKLKKLFESAVLTDEIKKELSEAFDTAVSARSVELEAEFEQKLEEAKTAIADSIPSMVEEALAEEMAAIAEEVAHARNLEVGYAKKLTEFKESYAAAQDEKLQVLVAEGIATEVEELRESIELAKKNDFGMKVFEAYREVFDEQFGGIDASELAELKEAKEELGKYQRKEKMTELLEGISGEKRAIAETILDGVATEKLDEKFAGIRGVLLAENDKGDSSERIDESAPASATDSKGNVVIEEGLQLQGDDNKPQQIDESAKALLDRLNKSVKLATTRR